MECEEDVERTFGTSIAIYPHRSCQSVALGMMEYFVEGHVYLNVNKRPESSEETHDTSNL